MESCSKKRLSTTYYIGSDEEHLYTAYLKAVLIRYFLVSKLTGNLLLSLKTGTGRVGFKEKAKADEGLDVAERHFIL